MVRIGIVGVGFMGWMHFLAYQRVKKARVQAIVSREAAKRRGDWRSIRGNFGPPGAMVDLSGIAAYEDLSELLRDPRIDLVDICLPPALHAEAAIAALRAGKHVLCEKPIAVSLADARRMFAAAQASGRRLLIGHVLPFFPEYAFALRLAQSQQYGRAIGGHFKRIISEPHWLPDFYDPNKVGGPLIDLHIHDAHFIRLLFGRPQAVFTRGRMRGAVAEFASTQFLFKEPEFVVTAVTGAIPQQSRAFTHSYEIYFERATALFDFAVIDGQPNTAWPVTLLKNRGPSVQPKLKGGDPIDAFAAELSEACQAIEAGRPSPSLEAEFALDALVMCHKQQQSIQQQRMVRIGRYD